MALSHPKAHLLHLYTDQVDVAEDRLVELVFLGTGTSSCLPNIHCLAPGGDSCTVCNDAFFKEHSKNKRRTTSISVRFRSSSKEPSGEDKLVIIDCGRMFVESVLDWVLLYNQDMTKLSVEALLITHGHADAILGLDDVRHFTARGALQRSMPVHCDRPTLDVISAAFPYLIDPLKATGGGAVSKLDFCLFDSSSSNSDIVIDDFAFKPLQVQHGVESNGNPFYSNGFRFGSVSYISDVSSIEDPAYMAMKGSNVLIIDALSIDRTYKSHFSLPSVLQTVKRLQPKFVYLIGLAHQWHHDEGNRLLAEHVQNDPELHGIQIKLSYDGLRLKFHSRK